MSPQQNPYTAVPSSNDDISMETDEPEMTLRAVIVGLLIGVVLCFTNTSFGLQSGWVSLMSLQSSLLGFAVFKVLPQSGFFGSKPLTVHENVLLQTVAVATGILPLSAGLIGVIPGLGMLNLRDDNALPLILPLSSLILWCLAVAFFGVFLAVPLRKQVLLKENLVFPSGTATAQVISVLHNVPPPDDDGTRKRRKGVEREEVRYGAVAEDVEEVTKVDRSSWTALTYSFLLSSAVSMISLLFPVLSAIPIFDMFGGHLAANWLWFVTPSFSYVGQGIIMGFPTTASMSLGMMLGWAVMTPLADAEGWTTGDIRSDTGGRAWILWPALAIMTVEALLSIATMAYSIIPESPTERRMDVVDSEAAADISRERSSDRSRHAEWSERGSDRSRHAEWKRHFDVPSSKIVWGGIALSIVGCVVIVSYIFGEEGIKAYATLIALVLASLFAVLGVRALGETDLNPVSAIGKISQLVFAVVQPNNIIASLVAGGIAEAGASQAGDLMQDLKTGDLLGSSPNAQFKGQLIGSLASCIISPAIYVLYRSVYTLPSNDYPVPTAAIWLNLARLLNRGSLPPKSPEAMIVFGAIFFVIATLKVVTSKRKNVPSWNKFIPSGIAVAIGFINTPSFSIARLIGGLVSLYFSYNIPVDPKSATPSHLKNFKLIIVASGFVLGEGLTSVVGLLLRSATGRTIAISCFGCGSGGGGYCAGGC